MEKYIWSGFKKRRCKIMTNNPKTPTTHYLNDGVFYFVKCVFSYAQSFT